MLARQAAPWVSLLDESAKIVTSRLGPDRFRVAGTAEFNGFNRDIRADRVAPLVAWTRRHFPDAGTSRVIPWAGLRPMLPSMLPKVGKGRRKGVFYNTGHGHLGWTLLGELPKCIYGDEVGRTKISFQSDIVGVRCVATCGPAHPTTEFQETKRLSEES